MLAGVIRLAVAAWGVTLAYLMIGSFNLGLLTWYTEQCGTPRMITQVLSAVLGLFFLVGGLCAIAAEFRSLLFRRRSSLSSVSPRPSVICSAAARAT